MVNGKATKEDFQAMKKSLRHWKENVLSALEKKKPSTHWDSCPLCRLYIAGHCSECPVGYLTLLNCYYAMGGKAL